MDSIRTTTRDIRRHNRSVLLSKLFFDGPLSRLELSQQTGLSSATVSTVTAELIDDRLIVEAGQVDSGGGRPRVLLRVDPSYGFVVGADVGETGVNVELFDLAMTKLAVIIRPLPSVRPTPEAVVGEILAGIEAALADAASVHDDDPDVPVPGPVMGIGIGVPGIVEHTDGVLVHAPTIGWQAVDLEAMLRARGVTAPVFIGNGAQTQAQAEMWFGAARGARHAIVALVGSGVGAAIISGGGPYQGVSNSAGEWGHTTLVYGGRTCRCGARGCLEAYVGAEGILEQYHGLAGHGAEPEADEVASLLALIDKAANGEPEARALIDSTVAYLGAGIGNLINLFNPERVVLGGWAGLALGGTSLADIRAAAQLQALAQPYAQVTIELSQLGPDAVAFGAATLPLAALLNRGEAPRPHELPDRAQ
jgi:predicted NBD/HSP70 family sugar kinase